MTTLRTQQEGRQIEDIAPVDLPKSDPQMLDIVEKIVDQQRGEFDPSKFVDRYEHALREVIDRKPQANRSGGRR